MKMPSFSAEASLYKTSGRYQAARQGSNAQTGVITPAIPA